jgi:hypothetical protein
LQNLLTRARITLDEDHLSLTAQGFDQRFEFRQVFACPSMA